MIKRRLVQGLKRLVLIAMISAILFSVILVFQNKFPIFKYIDPNELPPLVKNDTSTIGQETGEFLWMYRAVDVIAQAFVLFATAVCCVILLRAERRV
ncbi:MAG: hypothetical protein PVF96_04915 [Candidatus Bathyarchaeota archaeon]|jgi:hypothetical protein